MERDCSIKYITLKKQYKYTKLEWVTHVVQKVNVTYGYSTKIMLHLLFDIMDDLLLFCALHFITFLI